MRKIASRFFKESHYVNNKKQTNKQKKQKKDKNTFIAEMTTMKKPNHIFSLTKAVGKVNPKQTLYSKSRKNLQYLLLLIT